MIARSVTIVGVGLIGGSLGLALKSRGLVERITGLGRDPARLELACRRGAIDHAAVEPAEAFSDAELAIICTPVSRIVEDAQAAATHGPPELIITDVGSTKRRIVEALDADPTLRGRFVGSHPIAGSERTGVEHADGDLFRDAPCVITPGPRAREDAVRLVANVWKSVGCRVRTMTPGDHDRALALVSHLPHALAAALVHTVPPDDATLAGGAYRDVSRVAASDETLWTDIFLANREATLHALDALERNLAQFRRLLEAADLVALADWWREARWRRRDWSPGQPASPPLPGTSSPGSLASGADPR